MTTTYMTQEQWKRFEERKKVRQRVDLRGKKLTPTKGGIVEIEEALLAVWVEFQDQPDEIVVDSLTEFTEAMIAMDVMLDEKAAKYASDWRRKRCLRSYRTKFCISPDPNDLSDWIPVFDTV